MKKRIVLSTILISALLSSAACASAPESSVVTNKDLDSMISEAGSAGEDSKSYGDIVNEVAADTESYQTYIEDKSLGVTVDVDAAVVIPDAEQLSVMRVSQEKISQEFLGSVMETLTPGVSWYDGSATTVTTKAEIAKELQAMREYLTEYSDDPAMVEELQENISELEAAYETAPDRVDVTASPLDGKLSSVKELYDADSEKGFYQREYELNPDGEVFYGVNDASDGNYISLYVQNNENYGNCLRYESSAYGYLHTYSVALESSITDIYMPEDGDAAENFQEGTLKKSEDGPATLSESEAASVADALLANLGMTDFSLYEGGLCCEILGEETGEDGTDVYLYREVYEFLYLRTVDGVFVNNSAGSKFVDDWNGTSYSKKMWNGETVIVYVNDSGVVGFQYLSPLSVDETIVEDCTVKSFEEIKDTFEQMVVIQNAIESDEETGGIYIEVDSVNLVYARISEQDSFDTGILIPVWDFEGTVTDQYGETSEGSVISINAIDSSIIDWELGY